ncbi:hypothetical protein PJJ30_24815 [Mycobacterium kansasii]
MLRPKIVATAQRSAESFSTAADIVAPGTPGAAWPAAAESRDRIRQDHK